MSDPHAILGAVARDNGTPCFVYFLDDVAARVGSLREAFAGAEISFAVKSNPHPALLRWLRERVDRLDVSSEGELAAALGADWEPARLSFTGPGKREAELEQAVRRGVGEIVLESVEEATALDAIAAAAGGPPRPVLARLAPHHVPRGFGVNMAGRPSAFGIDEEDADAAIERIDALPHLALEGFHVYAGTQCLDPDSLVANFATMAELFERFAERASGPLRTLVFGTGFGIPYPEGDEAFDLDAVASGVRPHLERLRASSRLGDAAQVLELGRWLVGEAGLYLTRVLRVKHSRGAEIAICDGGMHHHLAAAGHLGSVIPRNYRIFAVLREDEEDERAFDIVGPLCTSIDTLGRRVSLPPISAGDVLAIRSSGAYGPTASPTHFLSQAPPKELLVETRNGFAVVTDVSAESTIRAAR